LRFPGLCRVAIAALVLLVAPAAVAGELEEAPFGLRLGLATDRASSFTDVVGLAASAAYPYASSVNPAAGDFFRIPPYDYRVVGTLTGNYVAFEDSGWVTAGAGSITYRVPSAGTIIMSYTRLDSHDARSRQGDRFVLRSDDVAVRYSDRFGDGIAVGGGIRLSRSSLGYSSRLEGFPVDTDTDSKGFEIQAGALAPIGREWLVGLSAAAGWNDADTEGEVAVPAPFGPLPIAFNDFTRSKNIRAGLGWRPSESLGFYGDVQYLELRIDEEAVDSVRGFAGVEYLPITAIALRLGASADSHGEVTAHAGLGVYPWKFAQFELAYVYNAFPELRREFGRAHLFSASFALVF
jgi:hypothetical protein